MAVYRATARRRAQRDRQAAADRRQRAWETARRAAELLKQQFGVGQVRLFGSLARNEPLSWRSDVDLAVWGLEERIYYQVVAALQDLTPDIAIDLLRAEDASPSLLAAIEREGVLL
jgi:predicted nucleotidyltransferase